MKYLPLREIENVTSALNFHTADCLVTGGCDVYTTKAAGSDKKLYKNIENSLESQHESLLRLSASLSPPNAEMINLNLSRSSPFGPLSQVSSRRTFAYLIATLNASHPDYDFSHVLRPADFVRQKNLKAVMTTIDETLYRLRPRPATALLATPAGASVGSSSGPQTPGGSSTWGPRMWKTIDKEMSLRECDVYCYSPDDDPFDGEETAIWSHRYLFFNKERKRVCYLHIRGLSMLSHSPSARARIDRKRARPVSGNLSVSDLGGEKRARFWLGNKAEFEDDGWGDDDSVEDLGAEDVEEDDDENADANVGGVGEGDIGDGGSDASLHAFSDDSEDDNDDEDDDAKGKEYGQRHRHRRSRSEVRHMSEHMTEMMEV